MLRADGYLGYHRCRAPHLRQLQGHQKLDGQRASRRRVQASVLPSTAVRRFKCHRPTVFPPTHTLRFRLRHRFRTLNKPITAATDIDTTTPAVMVNSCTGKMGCSVAEAVLRAGLPLVPMTITGDSREATKEKRGMVIGPNNTSVEFIGLEDREQCLKLLKQQYPRLIIVDFTLPDCVNDNGKLYGDLGLNFVMGTTGGDREQLMKDVHASGVYAVIAPQMGKQIVAFQAMLKYMGDRFPGAFANYSMTVEESHQSTKIDTSGTARAVVHSFGKLGAKLDKNGIVMIRDPKIQIKEIGVPEDALKGHAYHTYHLSSPDSSVHFEFQHNVAGRRVYAEGTVDAVVFLFRAIKQRSTKKIFNMIDVLEAGSMR